MAVGDVPWVVLLGPRSKVGMETIDLTLESDEEMTRRLQGKRSHLLHQLTGLPHFLLSLRQLNSTEKPGIKQEHIH